MTSGAKITERLISPQGFLNTYEKIQELRDWQW